MCTKNINNLFVAYVVSHVIALLSIILLFYWIFAYNGGLGFDQKTLFNWHPILLTIGMIFLLGNGMAMQRIWKNSLNKNLRLTHFGVNALGLVFTLLGAIAVINFKYENRALQFFSLHSWIGFLGILLYLLYFFQAMIREFIIYTQTFFSDEGPIPFSVCLGLIIFISGISSIISGYNEVIFLNLISDDGQVEGWSVAIANYICVLCTLYGVLVILILTKAGYDCRLLSQKKWVSI